MRFGKRIDQESVAEWRDRYIAYKALKKLLKREDSHSQFWKELEASIKRTEEFFQKQSTEAFQVSRLLSRQCELIGLESCRTSSSSLESFKPTFAGDSESKTEEVSNHSFTEKQRKRAEASLQSSFLEFHRGLMMLRSFCVLNSEAVVKILKKHDKRFSESTRREFIEEIGRASCRERV